MNIYRLRAWTGPTCVNEIANALRKSDVFVVSEGTEHVIVNMEGGDSLAAAHNVLAALLRVEGTDFGLRFERW